MPLISAPVNSLSREPRTDLTLGVDPSRSQAEGDSETDWMKRTLSGSWHRSQRLHYSSPQAGRSLQYRLSLEAASRKEREFSQSNSEKSKEKLTSN
ncbi:unnamed protein product [Caretta caretta]